jgi:hypothetical protein
MVHLYFEIVILLFLAFLAGFLITWQFGGASSSASGKK